MTNAYPEKPLVPYQRTQVDMRLVIAHIQAMKIPVELKRAVYIFFRFESANGRSGINNNYGGFQADSNRWPAEYDHLIIGVVAKKENGTGKERLFCAFKDFTASVDFLASRLQKRGLYIGGTLVKIWKGITIRTITGFCRAYEKEWVKGDADAEPSQPKIDNFTTMYRQSVTLFPA